MHKLPTWLNDLLFKLRLTWKRLLCNHDYVLMEDKSIFYRHRCKKCNKVVLQRKIS